MDYWYPTSPRPTVIYTIPEPQDQEIHKFDVVRWILKLQSCERFGRGAHKDKTCLIDCRPINELIGTKTIRFGSWDDDVKMQQYSWYVVRNTLELLSWAKEVGKNSWKDLERIARSVFRLDIFKCKIGDQPTTFYCAEKRTAKQQCWLTSSERKEWVILINPIWRISRQNRQVIVCHELSVSVFGPSNEELHLWVLLLILKLCFFFYFAISSFKPPNPWLTSLINKCSRKILL